jgi:hypothetical protein
MTWPEFFSISENAYPEVNLIPKSYSVLLIVLVEEPGTEGNATSGSPDDPDEEPVITLLPANSFRDPVISG